MSISKNGVSRRDFLRLSAVTALSGIGATALAACAPAPAQQAAGDMAGDEPAMAQQTIT